MSSKVIVNANLMQKGKLFIKYQITLNHYLKNKLLNNIYLEIMKYLNFTNIRISSNILPDVM